MSALFNAASSFASAIATTQRNCYWYGKATLEGDDIVASSTPGKCNVVPRTPAAGASIGWPADQGFAFVGIDANQQPLAYTDCSGFATWLIAQTSPADFDRLTSWVLANRGRFEMHAQPWPSAAAFAYTGYATSAIGGNWSVVVTQQEPPAVWTQRVQPGDILAWSVAPVPKVETDTGHVVVLGSPLQLTSGTVYKAGVIDCSLLPHLDDSRKEGVTGVGTGSILLSWDETAKQWQYSFGVIPPGAQKPDFYSAQYLSVLRLNV